MGLFRLCHICVLLGVAVVLIVFFSAIGRTNTPHKHDRSTHQSTHQSAHQSTHQSLVQQTFNHIDNQSINRSVIKPEDSTIPYLDPSHRLINQSDIGLRNSTNQSTHKSTHNSSTNHSTTNQSTNQSTIHQSFKKLYSKSLKKTPSTDQSIHLTNFHQSIDQVNLVLSVQAERRSHQSINQRRLLIDASQFHSVLKSSNKSSIDESTNQSTKSSMKSSSDPSINQSTNQSTHEFVVPLHDSYHVMYTAQISVGVPGQLIDVVLDTGSSCLWVVSADLEVESTNQSTDRLIDQSKRSKEEAKHRAYHSQQPINQSQKQSHIPSYLQSYDHSLSSTYQSINKPWSIQYGVGECSGYLSRDTVTLNPSDDQSINPSKHQSVNQSINHQSINQLTVKNQVFAEATKLSDNFYNPHQSLSGIVGLSFKGGSCSDWPTLIDSLYDQSIISHKMFSFQLSSEYEQLTDDESINQPINQMIIGAPDRSLYTGDLSWVPVLHAPNRAPAMWFVRLDALRIQSIPSINQSLVQISDLEDPSTNQPTNQPSTKRHQRTKNDRLIQRKLNQMFSSADQSIDAHELFHAGSAHFCSDATPCIALPDSGTSFLTLPPKLFVSLISLLTHGRDDCMIDTDANVFCLNGPEGLPVFEFTFGDATYVLSPYDYMLPNQQLAIQVLDFGVSDLHILICGDVFLRSVYTVFDADQQRIGFAQSINSNSSYTSSRSIYEHQIIVTQRAALFVLASLVIFFLCCTCCLCYFIVNGCSFQWRRREYDPIQSL